MELSIKLQYSIDLDFHFRVMQLFNQKLNLSEKILIGVILVYKISCYDYLLLLGIDNSMDNGVTNWKAI